ncbi:hypothetical protein [Amycolatopsis sp. CA-126428]|uniref:hypothetical protein n=1 Tax=Amycolatopsis sp. CA-126428 TaxID=2073158 RepID=UPI001E428F7F|nr:hypothetical protein [Amycolatopsis sp. CA-126428]
MTTNGRGPSSAAGAYSHAAHRTPPDSNHTSRRTGAVRLSFSAEVPIAYLAQLARHS